MSDEYHDYKIKEDRWGKEGALNFTLYDGQKLIDMFQTRAEANAKVKELQKKKNSEDEASLEEHQLQEEELIRKKDNDLTAMQRLDTLEMRTDRGTQRYASVKNDSKVEVECDDCGKRFMGHKGSTCSACNGDNTFEVGER